MSYTPESQIHLCKVPFDASYKHQVRFDDPTSQYSYFGQRVIRSYHEYCHVRKTLPDGGTQSAVRVAAHIDDLQFVNYMMFNNGNLQTDLQNHKTIFAFVTKKIYINEGTTELVFETDVFQTYMFVARLGVSFVVREHAETDNVGDNIEPEHFQIEDYVYSECYQDTTLDKWGYMVVSAGDSEGITVNGKEMSGIYQSLKYKYFEDITSLNQYVNALPDNLDTLEFISVVPRFIIDNQLTDAERTSDKVTAQYIEPSAVPAWKPIDLYFSKDFALLGGYSPKNKKLCTYPYYALSVTNNAGKENIYIVEDFDYNVTTEGYHNVKKLSFDMWADVSTSPSVCLVPISYKGVSSNIDESISITGFPQCATATDTYRLWWAKNKTNVTVGTLMSVGGMVASAGASLATGGAAGAVSLAAGGAAASGVMNTILNMVQAYKEPNKVNKGNPDNNLLTAMKQNRFVFRWRTLKREHAEKIDQFFTLYGYQTNRVKLPNTKSRPYWNYVQTMGCNLLTDNVIGEGGIPNDDLLRLKRVYDEGVTIWNSSAKMYDYTQDNRA